MAETLFDAPIAHRDDPQTSYDAGDRMIELRKLQKQENEVWVTILYDYEHSGKWHGYDFTAKEISRTYHLGYYVIQRRLSGLHRKGKIERTGEKRNGCCVWRLK